MASFDLIEINACRQWSAIVVSPAPIGGIFPCRLDLVHDGIHSVPQKIIYGDGHMAASWDR